MGLHRDSREEKKQKGSHRIVDSPFPSTSTRSPAEVRAIQNKLKILLTQRKRNPRIHEVEEEEQRLLVSVEVLGSAGDFKLVVSAHGSVEQLIKSVLKRYDDEKRVPVLGRNSNDFRLLSRRRQSQDVDPSLCIGVVGTRDFLLVPKEKEKDSASHSDKDYKSKSKSKSKTWFQSLQCFCEILNTTRNK